jgi:hypothetical protein
MVNQCIVCGLVYRYALRRVGVPVRLMSGWVYRYALYRVGCTGTPFVFLAYVFLFNVACI